MAPRLFVLAPFLLFSQTHAAGEGSPCLNGGSWKTDLNGEFYCDCSTTAEFAAHAGFQCEHFATSYCVFDSSGVNPVSKKSFCTNHGKCRQTIMDDEGEVHPGCICKEGWTGHFCEYEVSDNKWLEDTFDKNKGEVSEGLPEASVRPTSVRPSSAARGGAIFMLVVVCLAIVAGIAFIVRARFFTRSTTPPQNVSSAASAASVDVGNRAAPNVEEDPSEREGEII